MKGCRDPGFADRYDEQWFLELPPETQRLFQEQDLDRAAALHKVETGEMTKEQFIGLCKDQIAENEKLRHSKNKKIFETVAEIRAAMRGAAH